MSFKLILLTTIVRNSFSVNTYIKAIENVTVPKEVSVHYKKAQIEVNNVEALRAFTNSAI